MIMLKLKKEQGITLIALVITIIVLLILAGVTINLTLGEGGFFKIAQKSAKNYTEAQNKELMDLNTFTTYTELLTEKTQMNQELLKLKVGDYIKYDSKQNENKNENGEEILWRVLYPADSEYGLQIISDKCVEKIAIGGEDFESAKKSYNNAIKTLNDASMKYVNYDYAIDGRCVGTNPKNKNEDSTTTYSLPEDWSKPSDWASRDTGCLDDNHNDIDWKIIKSNNLGNADDQWWYGCRLNYFFENSLTFEGYSSRTLRVESVSKERRP